MTAERPSILYDYGGFPPDAYTIQWPAPGDPALARRVVGLLEAAGIATREDGRRGFDHGTFIPFKISWPPREEHLLPLMVVAGAAGTDHGRVTFSDDWMHTRISAFHYG